MFQMIDSFIQDESGATAIEYGLIAALVSVGGISALASMGNQIAALFGTVGSTISAAVAG